MKRLQRSRQSQAFVAALLGALAAPAHGLVANRGQQEASDVLATVQLGREFLSNVPMHMYRQDCWKSRPVSSAFVQAGNPGAGIDQSMKPFQQVLKDGFYAVDCVKDYMFEHGDKYGNNKYNYQLASRANVSIVLYNEIVPKGDRKPMTPNVCFAFCRTVPDMLFFGIHNGRTCYCTPYYSPMAGDASSCDVPCEGNPTAVCGGSAKSSIWSMHMCGTNAQQLLESAGKLESVGETLTTLQHQVAGVAQSIQAVAAELQPKLGAAGDPAASALMQSAKVFAGELQHAGEAAGRQLRDITALRAGASALAGSSESSFAAVAKMEQLTEDADKAVAMAEATAADLSKLVQKALPEPVAGAGAQYYPALYFVDKAFAEAPSTCGGEAAAAPVVGTFDACAAACDAEVHTCVGFGFFPDSQFTAALLQTAKQDEKGLCFLFSKLTSVTYYTGCSGGAFLQKAPNPKGTKCVAKLSKFEGTTLKPDPSGKCEQCLKAATKADRCFA